MDSIKEIYVMSAVFPAKIVLVCYFIQIKGFLFQGFCFGLFFYCEFTFKFYLFEGNKLSRHMSWE